MVTTSVAVALETPPGGAVEEPGGNPTNVWQLTPS